MLACENAMRNTSLLKKAMADCAVDITMAELDEIDCYPNTAVDRMVFDAVRDGKKAVDIGKDFELAIEKNQLLDPESQPIRGAEYAGDLQKFLERKLYMINCGHAWAGYIGFLYGYDIIQDVFKHADLVQEVRRVMQESAGLLQEKYDFTKSELDAYIDFSINRFQTPGITDTINRVARSPIRKLAPDDRLTGPCVQCEERRLNHRNLLKGIAATFLFENPKDAQCLELGRYYKEAGIEAAITKFTGIAKGTRMFAEILRNYGELAEIKKAHRK